MILDHYLNIGFFYAVYLICTKNFSHFLEKKRLVKGDLVFIKYRGKYRKAYIRDILFYNNGVQLQFDEKSLNTADNVFNTYPLSRIIIPDFMSKTAKLLYSDVEQIDDK